jgi:hypothetical protein
MFDSSSPLLNGQNVTDPSTQILSAISMRAKPQIRSRTEWTWISVVSSIFNTTILIGLLYGVGICVGTIQKTLMPTNEYCLHSVSVSYNYITFSGEGYNTYYGPKCLNPLRTISTYASGKTFCTDKEIQIGFEKIRKECEKEELEFLDWRHIVANVTDDNIARMKVVEFDEIPTGENVTEPIRLSEAFFHRVDNTLVCLPQLLFRFRQLTFTEHLGVRDELASSVGLRSIRVLGHCFMCLGYRSFSQNWQYVVLASHAVKQNAANHALSVDVGQSQLNYSASVWLTSSTPPLLVHDPHTHGERYCDSFLSLYDISLCISLSFDIQQHLVRTSLCFYETDN